MDVALFHYQDLVKSTQVKDVTYVVAKSIVSHSLTTMNADAAGMQHKRNFGFTVRNWQLERKLLKLLTSQIRKYIAVHFNIG